MTTVTFNALPQDMSGKPQPFFAFHFKDARSDDYGRTKVKILAKDIRISAQGMAAAEAVAIEGLGFLASDPARLARFLTESGYDPAAIRAEAGSPHFLAGVLEYLLSDESLLLVFTSHTGTDPKHVASARRTLGGLRSDEE